MPITISTDLLVAVSRWASSDETRPFLRVVLFKGNEMIACDGHRLVRVPVDCDGLALAIHRNHIAAAVAAQEFYKDSAPHDEDLGGRVVKISKYDQHAVIDLGVSALRVPLGDSASFPPIDQVMPKERPPTAPDGYGFDPKYLAAIHDVQVAAGAVTGQQMVRVTGWSADGLGPMLFEGIRGIRYVIMPGRV